MRLDVERAKNEADVMGILDSLEEKEKLSILAHMKNAALSNKEFIVLVVEVLMKFMK